MRKEYFYSVSDKMFDYYHEKITKLNNEEIIKDGKTLPLWELYER